MLKDFFNKNYLLNICAWTVALILYEETSFQKNCCLSPACTLCDAPVEDPKHYFLYCPSFAALRKNLFTSAALLLGNRWHCASDMKKIDWFLNGISHVDFDTNVTYAFSVCSIIYFLVQPFLLNFVLVCVCFLFLFDRHVVCYAF